MMRIGNTFLQLHQTKSMKSKKRMQEIWLHMMAAKKPTVGDRIHSELHQQRRRPTKDYTIFFFPERCIKEGSIVGVKQPVRKLRDGLQGAYIMVLNHKGFPIPYITQCASKFASTELCKESEKTPTTIFNLAGTSVHGYVIDCVSNVEYIIMF